MRKLIVITFSVLFLFALPTITVPGKRGISISIKSGESIYVYKDYYALVVGISDYEKWPDLPNAVKDAQEVSLTLKRLGFNVKMVLNPTSQELRNALSDLTYEYGRTETRAILFYYAGHGETEVLVNGTRLGYIAPSDCPLLRNDPQNIDKYSPVSTVIKRMKIQISKDRKLRRIVRQFETQLEMSQERI